MNKLIKTMCAAALAVVIGTPSAHAASLLAGDFVTLGFVDDGAPVSTWNGTIGAGADIIPYGALNIDLNAGPAGDQFTISSNGTYCGLACDGSIVSMVFTGLDFGTPFSVDNFVDTTGLNAFVTVLSDTSFSITWTGASGAHFFPATTAFSGSFGTIAPVPLPAPLALLAFGVGGLALKGRRRRTG